MLPGLREFLTLLYALDRLPQLTGVRLPQGVFPDVEALQRASRRPLWVLEDSKEDAALKRAVRKQAVEAEGGVILGRRQRFLAVVTWEPSAI